MKIFDDIKQVQGTGKHMLQSRAPTIDLSVATRTASDLDGEVGIEIFHELRIWTKEIIKPNANASGVAVARQNYISSLRKNLFGEILDQVLQIFYTDEIQKSVELKAEMQTLINLLTGVKDYD